MTLLRARTLTWLWLLAVIPLAPLAQAENTIDGRWLLDLENSDDVQAVFDAALKPSKKRKKAQHNAATAGRTHKPSPLLATESLTIRHRNATIEIIPAEGKPLVVVPDGHTAPVSLSNWGADQPTVQQFSGWEGDTLVVESTREGGTRITQSYRVNQTGELVQDIELFAGPRRHAKAIRLFKPAIVPDGN